jgi:LDH2 family malate/lactate/ureidoglycolate dehydrogenase
MAMSATAMGKIRLAAAQGRSISPEWATNAQGEPTTSPTEAINGMLLPAGGAKGFGLALAIDLLCGALSGGGVGAAVRPLYAQLDEYYNCAHAFIAIDARLTNRGAGIASQVAARADDIRRSKRAAGTERLYAPGDIERAHLDASNNQCLLTADLVGELRALAAQAGSNAVV